MYEGFVKASVVIKITVVVLIASNSVIKYGCFRLSRLSSPNGQSFEQNLFSIIKGMSGCNMNQLNWRFFKGKPNYFAGKTPINCR